MDELKFVLRCFLFTCLIVVFSQYKIQGITLEQKAFIFLQHSDTASFIRQAADGGVKLIESGLVFTKNLVDEKILGKKKAQLRRSAAEPVKYDEADLNDPREDRL